MSYGSELATEIMIDEAIFGLELDEIKNKLSKRSDDELLRLALKQGFKLNEVTEYFPAYDVAKKLLQEKRQITLKQRNAIKNVLAFYLARQKFINGYWS